MINNAFYSMFSYFSTKTLFYLASFTVLSTDQIQTMDPNLDKNNLNYKKMIIFLYSMVTYTYLMVTIFTQWLRIFHQKTLGYAPLTVSVFWFLHAHVYDCGQPFDFLNFHKTKYWYPSHIQHWQHNIAKTASEWQTSAFR